MPTAKKTLKTVLPLVAGLLAGLLVGLDGAPAMAAPNPAVQPANLPAALPAATPGTAPIGEARPILGWVEFCQGYPGECGLDLAEPARITLTPAIWTSVAVINRRVNRAVRPMTDLEHWGRPDRWDLAEDGAGDCEDYQLLKRHLLAEAGLPRRAMRMTVVIDEKGEGHAVLTLITDRGDYILDNKTNAVSAWHETGYVFVKREGQETVAWVSLGGATSPATTPVTTANR